MKGLVFSMIILLSLSVSASAVAVTGTMPAEAGAETPEQQSTQETPPPAGEQPTQEPPQGHQEEALQQGQFKRTVILIHKQTAFGEHPFIRGGIDHGQRQGCGPKENLDEDPCSISIKNRQLDIAGNVEARDAWAQGDDHLDWYGAEPGQGKHGDVAAKGTPAQWTTNDVNSDYYSSLNTFGPDYWLVDFDMDCSETQDGFFEFKGYLNHQWEHSNSLAERCAGDAARDLPYHSSNHFALCGYINVYEWGQGQCMVESFIP